MDEELFFRFILILIYGIFAVVRVYYRSQELGKTFEQEYFRKTKAIIILIVAILGYFFSLILWLIFPQTIDIFQFEFPSILRLFGAIMAVFTTILTVWVHHTLGTQYSARWRIRKDHQLITTGPYSLVRHPMYTTLNLFSFSVSIITANTLIIFFALWVAIPFFWITRTEEKFLIELFGEEYLEYMKNTGRFFPRF
ncbi:methyltransferase family protein [Candidatus Hodarchaeum mangrovi]